ncbi:MAG: D-ribose pyranase [Spirochaetales bacterium]|nr:D-ribose pyranase [Spirochaetales bacterium]
MKKHGILNSNISELIAGMGHGDNLLIVDAGFPVPPGTRKIDLALVCGIPSFIDTVEAALNELQVESIIIAREMEEISSGLFDRLKGITGEIPLVTVSHEELKEKAKSSSGIIRTGECTPFANIVLVSGVTF